MILLQVCPRIPSPPNDGGAVYIYNTTKSLSELGHTIIMASFESNRHDQEKSDFKKYAEIHSKPINFKKYGFLAVLKSVLTWQPITVQHRMDLELMNSILSEIHVQPDIILIEGIHCSRFIPQLRKKFRNTPIVLRQSNVEHLIYKRNAKRSKNILEKIFLFQQYFAMKRFELTAMKTVDAVTAISEIDLGVFSNELPKLNYYVSSAGADLPSDPDTIVSRESSTILMISHWTWRPNYDGLKWFLDNVWDSIRRRNPDIKLNIIGTGLSNKFISNYSRKNIDFLGFVQDLAPYRQRATIFLAPLFSGSGIKLKILESLAFGIPTITTDIGKEGIRIEDGKNFILANTAKEFEESIQRLLNDKELQSKLSINAQTLIKDQYSWISITEGLAIFLESVISSSKDSY
ncbi:MAG: glycosyltransferase family 4 protein [Cyanothece sp. SIO1E1]|nr:glycosyltransferase family 4 protein [Cyanothece sp. SIO1E1]